jgi:hypothetical protein
MSILRRAVLAAAGVVAAACGLPTSYAEPPANPAAEANGGQGKSAEARRAWGEPVEGQALSIATDKAVYACNEDIVVSMRLKNVGRTVLVDPRQTVAAHKAWYYSFSVALASGEGVPMTEHGKFWFDPREPGIRNGLMFATGRLGPGECFGRDAWLDSYYDMSRPGRYTIQAKWRVVANAGRLSLLQALSNRLEGSVLARSLRYLGFHWRHQECRLSPTEAVSNKLVITVEATPGHGGDEPRSPKGGAPPF